MKERLPGLLCCALAGMLLALPVWAFQPAQAEFDNSTSEMRPAIERFAADRASLNRDYPIQLSPMRQGRFKQFFTDWEAGLGTLNFESMNQTLKWTTFCCAIISITISANSVWIPRRRPKRLATCRLVRRF